MSQSTASKWVKIGSRYSELIAAADKLPPSTRSLYMISTLPKNSYIEALDEGIINPDVTFRRAGKLAELFSAAKKLPTLGTPPRVRDRPGGSSSRLLEGADTTSFPPPPESYRPLLEGFDYLFPLL